MAARRGGQCSCSRRSSRVVLWLVRRKRRPAPVPAPPARVADPIADALRDLASLRRLGLPGQGRFAEHAFLLTRIARRFLEATAGARAPATRRPSWSSTCSSRRSSRTKWRASKACCALGSREVRAREHVGGGVGACRGIASRRSFAAAAECRREGGLMRWEHPWLLLLLLVLPVLVARALRPAQRGAAVLWSRTGRWSGALSGALVRVVGYLPWAALVLAVIALARPQQGLRQSETETRGVDIMLAIDISPSMAAEDFRPLNRLYVAKSTARDFIRQRVARPHRAGRLRGHGVHAVPAHARSRRADRAARRPRLRPRRGRHRDRHGTRERGLRARGTARPRARSSCCSPTARTIAARSIR